MFFSMGFHQPNGAGMGAYGGLIGFYGALLDFMLLEWGFVVVFHGGLWDLPSGNVLHGY